MKIYINQIPESGLEFSESYESSVLELSRADIKFTEPINVSCQVTRGINNISVDLKIEAMMHLNCGRCLEEFVTPFFKEAELNFLLEHHQEVIDLTDNLREEIILGYPLKPLCRPDCLGLCPICGQNLNKGRCDHGLT